MKKLEDFSVEVARDLKVNDGEVISAIRRNTKDTGRPEIIGVDFAKRAAMAPAALWVKLANGKIYNILSAAPVRDFDKSFQSNLEKYRTNDFFKKFASPLFPLANRLIGTEEGEVMEASVMGHNVKVPVNNGRGIGEIRHHLHGLTFDRWPDNVEMLADASSATVKAGFNSGFYAPLWTGKTDLKIEESLTATGFQFHMTARNTGDTDVPVGGGAHPYFYAPSKNPHAVKLNIPGKKFAQIDGYKNVLPTGKILLNADHADMDFNEPEGKALGGKYLDNLWLDLVPNEQGFAYTEFYDVESDLKVRLTALTKNIIGIQCYTDGSAFAALELVTNLPDPREALWKHNSTGMQILKPGEVFQYGYKIEVAPIKNP